MLTQKATVGDGRRETSHARTLPPSCTLVQNLLSRFFLDGSVGSNNKMLLNMKSREMAEEKAAEVTNRSRGTEEGIVVVRPTPNIGTATRREQVKSTHEMTWHINVLFPPIKPQTRDCLRSGVNLESRCLFRGGRVNTMPEMWTKGTRASKHAHVRSIAVDAVISDNKGPNSENLSPPKSIFTDRRFDLTMCCQLLAHSHNAST